MDQILRSTIGMSECHIAMVTYNLTRDPTQTDFKSVAASLTLGSNPNEAKARTDFSAVQVSRAAVQMATVIIVAAVITAAAGGYVSSISAPLSVSNSGNLTRPTFARILI